MLRVKMEERFWMVGNSVALEQARELMSLAAPTTASVLITGESGVGKETAARAIHWQSPRAAEPFVAVSCDAIPDELIEGELFGQERGASTGAEVARKGRLQEADGGTLFLDEVADMSLAAQARLLRFLEYPDVDRPGSNEPVRLNVRVMAATNKNLVACIRDGTFREDLYHRLNVVTIRIPALRERPEDVEALTVFFLDLFCRQHKRVLSLAPECLAVLRSHDWPGNVRELRNFIERVVILSRADPVEPDELRSLLGIETPVLQAGALKAAFDRPGHEAAKPTPAAADGKSMVWQGRPHMRRRRHKHRRRHWWGRLPRRTTATVIVGLLLVLALLLVLLWGWLTGEWLLDSILVRGADYLNPIRDSVPLPVGGPHP